MAKLLLKITIAALIGGPFAWAESAPVCSQLFANNPTFNEFFYANLVHADPLLDLDFAWNLPYPSFNGRRGNKDNRDYVSNPFKPESPLTGIARFFGWRSRDIAGFYKSVYLHYEAKIRDQLIGMLKRVDEEIQTEEEQQNILRTSIGVVRAIPKKLGESAAVLGTFRVYDGSVKPWGEHYTGENPNLPKDGSPLPFQRVNRLRGIARRPLEDVLLAKIRSGTKVMEVGKFSIEGPKELRAHVGTTITEAHAMHLRVRNLIEGFWLERIVKQFPDDTIYVAHVDGIVKAEYFQDRYGFTEADRYRVPGTDEPECLLVVDGATLKKHLAGLTGIIDLPTATSP